MVNGLGSGLSARLQREGSPRGVESAGGVYQGGLGRAWWGLHPRNPRAWMGTAGSLPGSWLRAVTGKGQLGS